MSTGTVFESVCSLFRSCRFPYIKISFVRTLFHACCWANKRIVESKVIPRNIPFRDLLWVWQGRCFIFGALYPSKTGLIHRHIVKHIVGVSFDASHQFGESRPSVRACLQFLLSPVHRLVRVPKLIGGRLSLGHHPIQHVTRVHCQNRLPGIPVS